MVWYYQGYINLVYADDLPGARQNYLSLIQEEDATPQIKLGSYYTVSQLYLADEDFTNGIKYLLLWFQKSPEVTAQAERVKNYMNYQITYEMEEYDPELDQMLFYLPIVGSAFK